ncbi:HvfB family MNIO-type RiPP peptide maturase [Acinetobacter sp. ANC 4640]
MHNLTGVGLGLRRELIDAFLLAEQLPDFIEVAPENWMGFGGRHAKQFAACVERAPLICHGLSLSIGGPHPLNLEFIGQIKQFLKQHNALLYSEHLSYSHDGGYLYDLLPIPMTEAAVSYVAERILKVQDILGQRLVIENVSTYAMPAAEMTEAEFVVAVLEAADCELLLDVNNVYVNSINHGGDAQAFIRAIPPERVRYLHVAGHQQVSPDLLIDTHGAAIADPVWQLLTYTYQQIGVRPTLLERDFNLPTWFELQQELQQIRQIQQGHADAH